MTAQEFQVNTHAQNDQYQTSVTALADGGFVVSWSSENQDGFGGLGVYAQRFHADGSANGVETQVHTNSAGNQTQPSIAALSDGGFIVTWASGDQDGDGYGLFAQRFGADGLAVGDEYQVNEDGAGKQFHWDYSGGENTAVLENGQIVTVWDLNDDGANQGEVMMRIFDVPKEFDGFEDEPLPIPITSALVDQDGSETLTISLAGFPAGSTFNLGAADGQGGWVIENAETVDLSTLVMMPAQDWNGTFTLQVTATATELLNGPTASTIVSVMLTLTDTGGEPIFDDRITLTENDDIFYGLPGDTRIIGLGGFDILAGESQTLTLEGTPGSDTFTGGDDTIDGGGGVDWVFGDVGTMTFVSGGSGVIIVTGGNDTIDGGSGHDILNGEGSNWVVTSIVGGTVTILGGDDAIDGGTGNDIIVGDVADFSTDGSSGSTISITGGNDVLFGGNDSDTIFGDARFMDARFDSGGTTTITGGDDFIDGGTGNDLVVGDAAYGRGYAINGGNEIVIGGNDTLNGGSGADVIVGDFQNAYAYSNTKARVTGGDDVINGGAGNDELYGDFQNTGGVGILTGGSDTFVFETGSGNDIIYDFQSGLDQIDVSGYGFANLAQLNVSTIGSDTIIDFDGISTVTLLNTAAVTADDFIFV